VKKLEFACLPVGREFIKGPLLCGQTHFEVENKVKAEVKVKVEFPNAQITSLSWNLLTLFVRKVGFWNLDFGILKRTFALWTNSF
jgi:hypothetical protein